MSSGNIFEDAQLPPDMRKRMVDDFRRVMHKDYRPPLSQDEVCPGCSNKRMHCCCTGGDDE